MIAVFLMQVVAPEIEEAMAVCEEALRVMRAFLPAPPPEKVVLEFRLASALLVGRVSSKQLEVISNQRGTGNNNTRSEHD